MPNTSQLSKYLRVDSVRDGDVLEFTDAGVIKDKEFERNGTKEVRPVLEISVRVNGETKTYSPNGTTVKLLNEAWGTATEKWVGKRVVVVILPGQNGKNMIVAKPVREGEESKAKYEKEELPEDHWSKV